MSQDSAWLTLPTREITLPHVQAASGAKYSDGTVTFWNKGNSARLEVPPDTFPDCAGQHAANIWETAKLRGIDFRAVGNEPGWYLEIDDGVRIVAVVDYGEKRAVTPAPPPAMTDADTRRISYLVRTEAHRLSIVIAELPCADVMSGEEFPARVTLTLDGKEYQGCGRSLR
jgi:putative lipoprotein